jgi:hypothetical protein
MNSIPGEHLIDSLKRIDDDDAARLVSEQAFRELQEAIRAVPPAAGGRRRARGGPACGRRRGA